MIKETNYRGTFGRYGQLSGMVEPIAGILGCLAVSIAEPLLPYSLAFAAGAMIFVVVDDVIPEANTWFVTTTISTLLLVSHNRYGLTSLPVFVAAVTGGWPVLAAY